MERAYLSLGGNLGDVAGGIRAAVRGLEAAGAAVEAVSSLYATSPVGTEGQPDYVNAAARVATEMSAEALLDVCLQLEREAGRERNGRVWASRPLDMDIIFFGSEVRASERLTLPHPRFADRLFVLLPLLEIEPNLAAPDGRLLRDIVEAGMRSGKFAGQRVEKI